MACSRETVLVGTRAAPVWRAWSPGAPERMCVFVCVSPRLHARCCPRCEMQSAGCAAGPRLAPPRPGLTTSLFMEPSFLAGTQRMERARRAKQRQHELLLDVCGCTSDPPRKAYLPC